MRLAVGVLAIIGGAALALLVEPVAGAAVALVGAGLLLPLGGDDRSTETSMDAGSFGDGGGA